MRMAERSPLPLKDCSRGKPAEDRLERPAPNVEPGDVVVVADGREAIVTARVEVEPGPGPLVALLEVAIAPTPLTSDDGIA
jgi:hypothetical protein